jgi:beta-lactam-binding protein with PASTA domain
VDGMSVGQAQQTLKQLGFSVNVNKFGPFDKVFDYSPSGQQPKGSTITLFAGF